MAEFDVSDIIAYIKAVGDDLRDTLADQEKRQTTAQGHLKANYEEVRAGVLEFVQAVDPERLSGLSNASVKTDKPTNFSEFLNGIRIRNDEIEEELKKFPAFGEVASIPVKGRAQRTPNGLTAEQLKKKLNEEIERITNEPYLVRLAKILIKRGPNETTGQITSVDQLRSYDNAKAFLDFCNTQSGFFNYLRPSIRFGWFLNAQRGSKEYDILAQIQDICRYKRALEELKYIEELKAEYKDEKGIDVALGETVLKSFNSLAKFELLKQVMSPQVYAPLHLAFTKATKAQETVNKLKPELDHITSDLKATDNDVSILEEIEDFDSSIFIKFDENSYVSTIKDGRSGYTKSFRAILEDLEEKERLRREAEAAARRKREQEERERASRNSTNTISIGGGFKSSGGSVFRGGGSSGGGGASGSWITSDIEAEAGFVQKFDLERCFDRKFDMIG